MKGAKTLGVISQQQHGYKVWHTAIKLALFIGFYLVMLEKQEGTLCSYIMMQKIVMNV